MESVTFTMDDGSEVNFYVEEQTVIGGISYLLVSDSLQDEANCYILKDTSPADSEEASYEFVEDEEELSAVFHVFEVMMEEEDTAVLSY